MTRVKKLSIFLASPSDVQRERALVHEVIDEINRTVAVARDVVLDLVSSERAIPGYGKDGQEIINEQIGDMQQHDLFVGIMWNRIGTPTPRDISGTAEEFARAVNALRRRKKPEVWFYFRQARTNLTTQEELDQKAGVLRFRAKLRGNGLFAEYTTPQSFAKKFREHLVTWLNTHSQKPLPAPRKTRQPPAGRTRDDIAPARTDNSAPEGSGKKPAPAHRKPVVPAPSKRDPMIVRSPGSWIMLGDHFFRAQSSSVQADHSIMLRITPLSLEQTAELRALHAGDLQRRRDVTYADEHEAGTTRVQSVTSETSRGKTIFTVTLAPLPQQSRSGLSEFAYGNYSADAIAELRARWILLGQALPQEMAHLVDLYQMRTMFGTSKVAGAATLPQLWASLGTQHQIFLPQAWLYASYLLKTVNIVENILVLELGPIKYKKMRVRFRGRRAQVYDNRDPVSMTIEGECSLEA